MTPFTARVVEIAVLKLRPADRPELYHTLLNPQAPIPASSAAIHGITDADVVSKPTFPRIAPSLAQFLEDSDFSGFNLAHYDLPVLAREFDRAGVPFTLSGRAVVDVLALFQRLEPRTLATATRFYLGREHDCAHSARADAWATAEVLGAQLARHPDLPRDPSGLHRLLVEVDIGRRFRRGPQVEVVMGFGKYVGVPLAEVPCRDADYLRWLLRTDLLEDARLLVRRVLADQPPENLPGSMA